MQKPFIVPLSQAQIKILNTLIAERDKAQQSINTAVNAIAAGGFDISLYPDWQISVSANVITISPPPPTLTLAKDEPDASGDTGEAESVEGSAPCFAGEGIA